MPFIFDADVFVISRSSRNAYQAIGNDSLPRTISGCGKGMDIIEIASPLLQELVNYSTNALVRCETSTSGEENEDLAVLALYLHIIEMTDSIEVLVSQSCPIPAIPLIRSSFEALLSIEYILEVDYVRRSLSWLAGYVHKRLAFYESLDPSTMRGKSFQKALSADKMLRNLKLPFPDSAEVQRAIANLQRLLARPQFQPIEAELSKCKRKYKRRPNWYRLFGGPSSLQELARHLNRNAQYEFLYRHWSTISHAHDFSRFLTRTTEGDSAIRGLRDPSQIKHVTIFTASFILNATPLVLGKFRPGEDIAEWYKREVRERFLLLLTK